MSEVAVLGRVKGTVLQAEGLQIPSLSDGKELDVSKGLTWRLTES